VRGCGVFSRGWPKPRIEINAWLCLRRTMPDQEKIKNEIMALIDRHDLVALKKQLEPWLPADLAPIIADLPIGQLAALFRVSSRDLAAATFTYMGLEAQKKFLKLLTQEQAAALLNALPPDDRTAFLNELPLDVAMQLLAMLTPDERQVAQALLAYPEHTVGRMMTLDYVAVHPEWTVREALDYIREHGYDRETLNVIFAVDADGKLIDDIRVRRLLVSPLDRTVRDLLDGSYTMLAPTDDRGKALELFRKFDRVALPVTDENRKLIGIVTVDDMLDVAEEKATDDIQRLGGSEALDEPYLQIRLRDMIKKRAGWLAALFLSEMLTASAMANYEGEIEKAAVLALFIPLIISSGGNSGSQATSLVIRAMALGEVKLRDWWRVMRRELTTGLALGLLLGAIGVLRIFVWQWLFTRPPEPTPPPPPVGDGSYYGPHYQLVAITVGISLVGIVVWGSIAGSMLPFVLRKLRFDPASASAPFVATLVDVTGIMIYFSVAYLIMRGTLL
jgi:magnesium transporter